MHVCAATPQRTSTRATRGTCARDKRTFLNNLAAVNTDCNRYRSVQLESAAEVRTREVGRPPIDTRLQRRRAGGIGGQNRVKSHARDETCKHPTPIPQLVYTRLRSQTLDENITHPRIHKKRRKHGKSCVDKSRGGRGPLFLARPDEAARVPPPKAAPAAAGALVLRILIPFPEVAGG
ncbi:hypothetical protein EVAR_37328_1 [Eumeta japonica]|uniref:Uncharacterized protein n=1 Tax=Eumeta variegata TaxID=151549 RepID=A0A4C1WZ98_EUMVA|nr:hypothetical protein EVAR_37328_1 [Eumeta japonica]